jgi:hypothetical protein
MPYDKHEAAFTLYPQQSGYCRLPLLNVKFNSVPGDANDKHDSTTPYEAMDMSAIVQNMLTSDIFIMPKT